MAIYGYLRCSTNESKQDITRQQRDVKALAGGDKITKYFKEYESGSKINRVELKALLDTVTAGDTIVTTEVSRLSRSTKQFIGLVDEIKDKHLRLIVGAIVIDCRNGEDIDPTTKMLLNMLAVFGEFERDMIRERVKSGMNNAKAKGKHIGRRATTVEDIPKDVIKDFKRGYNNSDVALRNGLSRPTVIKYRRLLTDYCE